MRERIITFRGTNYVNQKPDIKQLTSSLSFLEIVARQRFLLVSDDKLASQRCR
jgi:hypothetical protein